MTMPDGWGIELNNAISAIDKWWGSQLPNLTSAQANELQALITDLILAATKTTGYTHQQSEESSA